MIPKPFLKWAGGKTQLIQEIKLSLPKDIINKKFTYIEPFVGSGAVLFWILEQFPNVEKAVINDVNADLINVYKIIKSNPQELIIVLEQFEREYNEFQEQEDMRKIYFQVKKELFNARLSDNVTHAGLFIFLNRTCFNGLYRVNRNNFFNVPIGSYKKPRICDAENLLAVNQALQKVEILTGDYTKTIDFSTENTLFYFDPPYKPLSKTSNFNSYAKGDFNDDEQVRLMKFCECLNTLNHHWILSNSDVESYFDMLYKDFNIRRVLAKRNINADKLKRGKITELLITNY